MCYEVLGTLQVKCYTLAWLFECWSATVSIQCRNIHPESAEPQYVSVPATAISWTVDSSPVNRGHSLPLELQLVPQSLTSVATRQAGLSSDCSKLSLSAKDLNKLTVFVLLACKWGADPVRGRASHLTIWISRHFYQILISLSYRRWEPSAPHLSDRAPLSIICFISLLLNHTTVEWYSSGYDPVLMSPAICPIILLHTTLWNMAWDLS